MEYQPGTDEAAAAFIAAFFGTFMIIGLIVSVFMLVCMWAVFTKAGEEGWKAIIPFYNLYVLTQIATGNGILFLIMLIPGVGWIFNLYVMWRLGMSFGKSAGFNVGLLLLPIVFLPMLAFGSAQYYGPFYNPELGYSVPPQGQGFGAPQAQPYAQPQAPGYGQPQAPTYGQPQAPGYGTPGQQPGGFQS